MITPDIRWTKLLLAALLNPFTLGVDTHRRRAGLKGNRWKRRDYREHRAVRQAMARESRRRNRSNWR